MSGVIAKLYHSQKFSNYTELREQELRTRIVQLLDGVLVSNLQNSNRGFSARTYINGSYGFASGTALDFEGVKRIAETASENAKLLNRQSNLGKPNFMPASPVCRSYDLDLGITESQEYIVTFARDLDALIVKHCPKIIGRVVTVRLLDMEKHLMTSDGVECHQIMPRHQIVFELKGQAASGRIENHRIAEARRGRFSEAFSSPQEFVSLIEHSYQELLDKLEGVRATQGEATVVLHPSLAGMLAHEAVGHTVEADLVRSGSVGGPRFGTKVASDLVSIVDFANEAFGETLAIPIYIDDEGTLGQDAPLITEGILAGYMHNKESALDFGHAPLGNARAFDYYDEPLIRMRNTIILPGTTKLEDMIASVESGYYLTETNNGQADATGEFMFGVCMGYEIKNGKLGRAILDTTISGIAFDALQTVTMVGDSVTVVCSGYCGKKQMIPVSLGGPALKMRLMIGG